MPLTPPPFHADDHRIKDWEAALSQYPNVQEWVVSLQQATEPLGYRHLLDILPDMDEGEQPASQRQDGSSSGSHVSRPVGASVAGQSLLQGGALVLPVGLPATLPEIFRQQAASVTSEWIFVEADGQEQRQSYAQCLTAAQTVLAGLRHAGLQAQDKVILQLGSNYDILTAFWACVLGGFIPVIMAPPPGYRESHNELERLLHVYRHLQQPYLLTDTARADDILYLEQWCELDRQRVLVLEALRGHEADNRHHASQADDVVFFTLTSGSTGAPKCIPLTHRNLIHRALGVNQANAYQASDVILNWLPFDHIGSISDWHIRCVILGCTLVYAPKEYVLRAPLNWLGLIDRYRITHSWAPNFAYSLILNTLAEQGASGAWDLSCVRALLTAGEAVSPATVAAFLKALAGFGFPEHAICPAFGMAEMGSGVTYFHASAEHPLRFHHVSRASLDSPAGVEAVAETDPDAVSFTSLGPPIPGVSLRIVDVNRELVPLGVVGQFQVTGAAVSSGYYQNPQANQQAFLNDGWFDTGDLGFFVDGELVISGRAKEVIIINGANFANAEIEAAVESVSGVTVSFTAACAVRMPGQVAEQLAIFFVPQDNRRLAQLLPAIEEALLKALGLMPAYLIPLVREAVPKTAIGKIQRKQLVQRLESGELDAVLRQVDVLLGNERTVPDWFYQRSWQAQTLPEPDTAVSPGLHLIVADTLGLADALRARLEALGHVCRQVMSAEALRPQLFQHPQYPLQQVWYLADYGAVSPPAQWLAVAQSLIPQAASAAQPLRLTVVASQTQVLRDDDVLEPAKAAAPAFLKSLTAEHPQLHCRHIDLPILPLAKNAASLLAEAAADDTVMQECAWRDGVRYVACLRKTVLVTPAASAASLSRGGMYLLTGGLGGMGVELATFLLQHYAARLLLVGKTALPVVATDTDTKAAARLQAWHQLEGLAQQSGGAVRYAALDVTDTVALQTALDAAEQTWQASLRGVFHLAGASHEKPVEEETTDSIAAMLAPKLAGALAIQPLLLERPQAFVVYSSSAAGFFGGSNIAAYAMANACLDALALQQRQQGLRSYSLAWSMWDDVGMSRGANVQALFAAKGYCLISPAEAMRSLRVALAQNQPCLLVGLDGGKAHVRQYRADVQPDAREWVAYCVLREGQNAAPQLLECDAALPCRVEVVDAIPRFADGTVDFGELIRQTRPDKRNASRYVAARTPLEVQLVALWQEVLKKPKVGVLDNFFALGGASLQVIQCVARLNQALGLDLLPGVLFTHPTIEALAQQVTGLAPSGAAETIMPRANTAPLQASFAQQRLWFLDELEAGDAYNIPVALRLRGVLDTAALQQALDTVVRRHEVLRTRFVAGESTLVLQDTVAVPLAQMDLSHLPAEEQETAILHHARVDAQRPFNLAADVLLRATLLRLATDEQVLLLNLHHIAGDGWSISVLARELKTLYAGFHAGQSASLPELPIQYADFAAWQRQSLQGERLEQLLDFWKQQLAGAPELLQLPTDFPRPEVESYQGGQQAIHIPNAVRESLQQLAQQSGATLYMILLAAFNVLLYRYSGQDDLVVGSPVACRNRSELEPLIGFFANTLALRTQLDPDHNFLQLLAQVRDSAQAVFDHQDVPFEKLVEELRLPRTLAYNPLVQVLFALQNVSAGEFAFAGIDSQPLDVPAERSLFDLELQLWETSHGLEGFFLYKTALFRAETLQRMAGHFLTLLHGIVANPRQALAALPLLSTAERSCLLQQWSGASAPVLPAASVLAAFEQQVRHQPQAIAVVVPGDDAATMTRLTYHELNVRANQLAHHLRQQGIGADMPVGLCVGRAADMLVGLLGILKSGGVYVPIDPAYPAERVSFMLEHARIRVVLTQQALADSVFSRLAMPADSGVCALDTNWFALLQQPAENPGLEIPAQQLAYMIYTSGSTGQPKGVMVEHGALASHTATMREYFALTPQDRVLQFASMSFDVALEQILPALTAGAQVVIGRSDWSLDAFTLHLQTHGISVFDLPPAYLQQLLVHWQAGQWQAIPAGLRLMVVGNDVVPPEVVALWREMGRGIRLLNAYGPTEATITATCHELDPEATPDARVPIGQPLPGNTAYVLDAQLQPQPVGVPGELYLGGSGVARGYLHCDDLTAERFLANPFGAGRLYRSGDLACWRPDGTLAFLGRVDHQVKLRGFRIELGEIETVLSQCPAVQEAAVTLREDVPGQKRLVAYWTAVPGAAVASAAVMQHLQAVLPAYMVPAAGVALDAMPHTANGKINRQALPAPTGQEQEADDAGYAAPTRPVEQQLADIWASVLGCQRVGIHDNFFALGGDSILSLQVVARARQQGLVLQPKQLFQHQTIAQLANVVEQVETASVPVEQGPVSGEVALSLVQHWFFAQEFADAHQHNLAFRAELAADVDPAVLAHAWRAVTLHHDMLRSRFTCEDGQWRQYCAERVDKLPVTVMELGGLPAAEQQVQWETERRSLQASLKLADGELQRMALFRFGAQQPARLFWVIHHLLVDGVSWRVLLEDLQTVYRQLQQGQAVQLPAKTTSFRTWTQWLAEAGVTALAGELPYWRQICAVPTTVLPADLAAEPAANTVASQAQVVRQLSAADTRSLLQDAHQAYHTQVNDLLLTALLLAVQQQTGRGQLRLDMEGHGREALDLPPGSKPAPLLDVSRTVGWFTSIYPVALQLDGSDTASAIKSVKEQLRAIPNRGMGYGILRHAGQAQGLGGQIAELCFNYLGQFDTPAADTALLRHAEPDMTSQPHSPRQQRPYVLEINCLVMHGQLQVDCSYSTALHTAARVESFVNAFISALQTVLTHCRDPQAGGYTSSDFAQARLKQNQLDQLMKKLKVSKR